MTQQDCEPEAMLTMTQVAVIMGVSYSTVKRLVREGTLPSIRPSERSVRIRAVDLTLYLRRNGHPQRPDQRGEW